MASRGSKIREWLTYLALWCVAIFAFLEVIAKTGSKMDRQTLIVTFLGFLLVLVIPLPVSLHFLGKKTGWYISLARLVVILIFVLFFLAGVYLLGQISPNCFDQQSKDPYACWAY